ncbi:MAG TPA: hypothetical protein VIU40_05285, partial [Geobacteraceae bacterium]
VDLTVGSPLLNASVGYYKRKEATKSSGASALDLYNEDYHSSFSWRPEGLPATNLNLERTNTFDGRRTTEDTTNDRATLGLTYLVRGVDLRYLFTYNDLTDHLQGLDVVQETHTGRISYGGQFFQERVSFSGVYTVSNQATTTTASGKGEVDFQVTPRAGLFALTDTPSVVALDATIPALTDGNVTVSSGINIGTMLPPQQGRNIGFDFADPRTVTNRVLVWIAPDVFAKVSEADFRGKVAPLYSWAVYASTNNQDWTPVVLDDVPQFGTFENRFELRFTRNPVTAQYLKVVVTPLNPIGVQQRLPAVKLPLDVFVSEIQAFQEKPAPDVQGVTDVTSHNLNLDTKVRLLDSPSLYYNADFFLASSSLNGFLKWTLVNALLADHRFNEVFSASGRVAREDSDEPLGHRGAYVYSATLRATPLPTLSHTLAYSGRYESFLGKTNASNSLYLNNTAALYRGVSLSLGGGASFITNETGENIDAYNLMCSLNVAPRNDLALNLNYTMNQTDLSGGSQGSVSTSTRRGDVGVTYRPFPAVYLLASLGVLEQTNMKTDVVQNYGVNWSPFPDGALQFNFSYQENVRTLNAEHSRLIVPSLTWKIASRTTLDLSYPLLHTTSTSGTTDSETLSAILRTSF